MSAVKTALTDEQALDMLAECFMEAPGSLEAQRLRDTIPGWDSMGALMLIAELDQRFGIELSAEESRTLRTVGDALAFLRRHGALQG